MLGQWTGGGNARIRIPSAAPAALTPISSPGDGMGPHRSPDFDEFAPNFADAEEDINIDAEGEDEEESQAPPSLLMPIYALASKSEKLMTEFTFVGDSWQVHSLSRGDTRAKPIQFQRLVHSILMDKELDYHMLLTVNTFRDLDWVEGFFIDGTVRLGQIWHKNEVPEYVWGSDGIFTPDLEIGPMLKETMRYFYPTHRHTMHLYKFRTLHVYFAGDLVVVEDEEDRHLALILRVVRAIPPRQYQMVILLPIDGQFRVSVYGSRQIYGLSDLKLVSPLRHCDHKDGFITPQELISIVQKGFRQAEVSAGR